MGVKRLSPAAYARARKRANIKPPRQRSAPARALADRKFHQRRVPSKKRHARPAEEDVDEMWRNAICCRNGAAVC